MASLILVAIYSDPPLSGWLMLIRTRCACLILSSSALVLNKKNKKREERERRGKKESKDVFAECTNGQRELRRD